MFQIIISISRDKILSFHNPGQDIAKCLDTLVYKKPDRMGRLSRSGTSQKNNRKISYLSTQKYHPHLPYFKHPTKNIANISRIVNPKGRNAFFLCFKNNQHFRQISHNLSAILFINNPKYCRNLPYFSHPKYCQNFQYFKH